MRLPAVYLLVLFLAIVFSIGSVAYQKRKTPEKGCMSNPFFVLLLIVLVFVAGFRYGVGTDYWEYYMGYKESFQECVQRIITFKEPGIRFISLIGRSIYNSGISVIFLSSLITIFLYLSTLYKYSPMFVASVVFYLFMGEWQGSFNGVRQYLASSILFFGHNFILKRELVKYASCVFIASLFHTTALVMIVPYFLLTNPLTKKYVLMLFIGTIVMLLNYKYIFGAIGYYKGVNMNMEDPYMTSHVSLARVMVSLAPIIVYFFLCKDDNKEDNKEAIQRFYINALLLNGIVMLATMNSTYLARLGIYTNAMCLIGYPYLFKKIGERFQPGSIETTVFSVYFAYWCYSILINPSLNRFRFWF